MLRVAGPSPARLCVLLTAFFVAVYSAGCGRTSASRASSKVTLAAVGDVLLTRGVGNTIRKHGADYPFSDTRKILSKGDIVFFNLECTLSKRGLPQRRRYRFRADPGLASALARNGLDVASLANNHTLDFGRDAMLDTIRAVEGAGMTAVGAGKDRNDALRVRVVTKNGLRVGFLAYTDLPTMGVVRLDDRPTVAGVVMDEIPGQIRRAKADCDVLVVSFHWGVEYMKRPTERQILLARTCIDNGADLVLGHHPHVLQPVEIYKGKPIVYSMGGFIWDSRIFGSDKSAIYRFELGRSSARLLEVIPIHVTAGKPRLSGSRGER